MPPSFRPANARLPGIPFPPPLLFAAGFGVGWLLHRWLPAPLLPNGDDRFRAVAGTIAVVVGLALTFWAMATFVRYRTPFIPIRPTARLVISGPYRVSRNPMYVGLTSLYLGLAMLVNTAWPLLFLPFVLFALYRLVIAREERYLGELFGTEYEAYRTRVRRWL